MQDIDNLISDCINQINEKITGLNYLEKLKYILIDKLKSSELIKFEDIQNKQYFINNEFHNFSIKIQKNQDASSKIKNIIDTDKLFVIIGGLKTLTIIKNPLVKSENQLFLNKNTGIVLPKNTIIDELISKDTILLEISFVENQEKDIEQE